MEEALPVRTASKPRVKRKVQEESVIRFAARQRIEHIILMIVFVALAVTGLAEKYYSAGWAEWTIAHLGGIASLSRSSQARPSEISYPISVASCSLRLKSIARPGRIDPDGRADL